MDRIGLEVLGDLDSAAVHRSPTGGTRLGRGEVSVCLGVSVIAFTGAFTVKLQTVAKWGGDMPRGALFAVLVSM